MEFPYPEPYKFAVPRLLDPKMSGWVVYALQTGLNAAQSAGLKRDGVFGDRTCEAVWAFQKIRHLEEDGIAGLETQRKLVQIICRKINANLGLPGGIPYGHAEHESSSQIGAYSPLRENNSRDRGVVQLNSAVYSDDTDAFDVAGSIQLLGRRLLEHHTRYVGLALSPRRAWELACGSWNAPAWTDRLARGETLPPDYSAAIEAYMDEVTKYVDWSTI